MSHSSGSGYRRSGGSVSHSSGSVNRPSGGNDRQRPSGGSGSVNRPSNDRPSGHNDRADRPSRPQNNNDKAVRPSGGNSHRPSGGSAHRPDHYGARPSGGSAHRPSPGSRPYAHGGRPEPSRMGRVHINHRPGYRPPRHVHRELRGAPVRFSHHGHHGYGHYIVALPPHYIHRVYHGIDYWYWDDVWYRYRAGRYWVCRPPFGYRFTPLADAVFTAILLNSLAENNDSAEAEQAKSLNLIRSYAAAGTEYFYNDGVFYIKGDDGEYVVIVPPAGAIVDALPEDYEEFEFEGKTYYKVDDTIYQMIVTEEGKACFEVLGQLAE